MRIDVVPRQMLDLCRGLLRIALARITELEAELERRDAPDDHPARGDGD